MVVAQLNIYSVEFIAATIVFIQQLLSQILVDNKGKRTLSLLSKNIRTNTKNRPGNNYNTISFFKVGKAINYRYIMEKKTHTYFSLVGRS